MVGSEPTHHQAIRIHQARLAYEPEIERKLKTPMTQRHQPDWTVLNAPYMRK